MSLLITYFWIISGALTVYSIQQEDISSLCVNSFTNVISSVPREQVESGGVFSN